MLDVLPNVAYVRRHVAFLAWTLLLSPTFAHAQTVTAMWDARPPSEQVTSYEVCIGTTSLSCNVQLATVSASLTSYRVTPTPGVLHYVAVRAVNASGRSPYSTEQVFSIPSISQLANRSTGVSAAITPFTVAVTDPDGSSLTFSHTGLPIGLTLNTSTGRISGAPTSTGSFNVTIFVNDGLSTASRSFVWTVTSGSTPDTTPPLLSITSHTSGMTVTSANQTIRGTATDSGRGNSGITSVRVNGQNASGGTAAGSGTANWSRALTLSPGNNTVSVEATDGAGNRQMHQITLVLPVPAPAPPSPAPPPPAPPPQAPPPAPFSITGLTSNRPSPQPVGTLLSFTASATGGLGPPLFKWWLFDGATWTMVRDWNTSTTYTWAPTQPGSGYRIRVWARDATMSPETSAFNLSVPFTISPSSPPPAPPLPGPLTLVNIGSNVPSPQAAGNTITFTAVASGGRSPYQFKWWFFDGTTWTVVRDWTTSATYAWTPTQPGTGYRIGVWVRDSTTSENTGAVNLSVPFTITGSATPSAPTNGSLRITALTSNLPSPQLINTPITFTASATGGQGPYQFKWWLFDGSTWVLVRDWSARTNYTWTPTRIDSRYRVGVWARDATTNANVSNVSMSVPFAITAALAGGATAREGSTLRIVSLVSNRPNPQQAGTTISFTASATGGQGPYQFKWWVFDGTTWTMARDWSTQSTYAWTPSAPGDYRIGIWLRDSTSNANISTWNYSVPFPVY